MRYIEYSLTPLLELGAPESTLRAKASIAPSAHERTLEPTLYLAASRPTVPV
jgi:hypothetical protein